MDIPNIKERRKHNLRFPMPDIPREAWCDFRIDFVEKNMTLVQLAEKYCCDPRTLRNHLQKQSYIKAVLEKQTNRDNYIKIMQFQII